MTTVNNIMTVEHFAALGLRLRDVQMQVAKDVEKTLAHKSIPVKIVSVKAEDGSSKDVDLQRSVVAMIEAGTGTGKTLAYLVPLLLRQMRSGGQVAVSTYTRALQRQIFRGDTRSQENSDLDIALALTGSNATVAMRLGRANFICRQRVADLDARLDAVDRERDDWQAFHSWVQSWDENTDPIDTTFMAWRDMTPDLPILRGQEMTEDMVSLDEGDEPEDAFWYSRHADIARAADVVVTNHATLLLNAVTHGNMLGDIKAVVIDEADRLRDAARSLMQRRIRWGLLYGRAKRRDPDKVTSSAKEHVEAIEAIMRTMGAELSYEDTPISTMAARMPALCTELLNHMRTVQLPLSVHDEEPVQIIIDAIASALEGEHVDASTQALTLTFSPVRRLPSFAIDPIDVRPMMTRLFRAWGDKNPIGHIVLTSATLSDPMRASMTHAEINFGIDTDAVVVRQSYEPSRYGRMTLVLPDPRVAGPFDHTLDDNLVLVRSFKTEWLDYLLRALDTEPQRKKLMLAGSFAEIESLIERRTGRTQAGHPATQVIDGVVYHQPDKPGHKLLGMLRDPSIRAIVTPSFWEGVNLVVDRKLWMQDLMIARMPIPPYSTVLRDRMVAHMLQSGAARSESEAGQRLFMQACADALRKLRQGIGRGIRGDGDAIRVWFLDPRLELPTDWKSALEAMDHPDAEAIFLAETPTETNKEIRHSRHPALQYWSRSLPTRFRGQLATAEMFAQDGSFVGVEMEEVV